MEDYTLTEDQIKAIKKVETAMNNAKKAGVFFWDDYGSMAAYNHNIIGQPVPDHYTLTEKMNESKIYRLRVGNFGAGNADDQLYIKRK